MKYLFALLCVLFCVEASADVYLARRPLRPWVATAVTESVIVQTPVTEVVAPVYYPRVYAPVYYPRVYAPRFYAPRVGVGVYVPGVSVTIGPR
jgi:hypothetical protein